MAACVGVSVCVRERERERGRRRTVMIYTTWRQKESVRNCLGLYHIFRSTPYQLSQRWDKYFRIFLLCASQPGDRRPPATPPRRHVFFTRLTASLLTDFMTLFLSLYNFLNAHTFFLPVLNPCDSFPPSLANRSFKSQCVT